MKNTLVCTVGTSLKFHLEKAGHSDNAISATNWLKLQDPTEWQCGAEVNSNTSILKHGFIDEPYALHLLVSDTDAGKYIGKVLDLYYKDQFESVEIHSIDGLHDQDFNSFKNRGLRNLVKELSEIIKKTQNRGYEAIVNATGGFKAQISFVGLIGQTLDTPVYYMFEKFSKVIEMPPMPVSFDFGLWLDHFELLEKLSEEILPETHPLIQRADPKLYPLWDTEDGEIIFSAMGDLFHEGFKHRFGKEGKNLLPPDSDKDPSEKPIRYEDDNDKKHRGLVDYLEKIIRVPYVTGIATFYYNPDLPKKNKFRLSTKGNDRVEGWYSDGKATTKFWVLMTSGSDNEVQAAVVDLTERFVR